jgi:hypothetical protein
MGAQMAKKIPTFPPAFDQPFLMTANRLTAKDHPE